MLAQNKRNQLRLIRQYFEWATFDSNVEKTEIKLKSLILAQIERWRHALHMQVERQRGLRPGGEWRTGE